jgi:hypothetical protein
MKGNFKVGDRVKVINLGKQYSSYKRWVENFAPRYLKKFSPGCIKTDEQGKVVAIHKHHSLNDVLVLIEKDNKVALFSEIGLEKVETATPTIVIYTRANETIATLKQGKEVIKTAKAKCNPSDTFDFEIGAKLAVERLFGAETKTVKTSLDVSGFVKAMANLGEAMRKAAFSMGFDWDEFKQGKFAVHCDTEDKAKAFLKECDEQGIKWCSGEKAGERTSWKHYKENTHYQFFLYRDGLVDTGICFGNNSPGRKVFEYQLSRPTVKEVKRPAKVGEWVKIINAKYVPMTNGKAEYKNGDILNIISLDGYRPRYANGSDKEGAERILNNDEYVVLENYSPSQPTKEKSLADYTDEEILAEIKRRFER